MKQSDKLTQYRFNAYQEVNEIISKKISSDIWDLINKVTSKLYNMSHYEIKTPNSRFTA